MKQLKKRSDIITIPPDFNIHRTGITQSLIGSFLSCRKKFVYNLNRWYHPESEKRMAFGILVHDVLDGIYSRKGIITNSIIDGLIDKFDTDELTKGQVYILLTEYIKYYKTDFTEKKFTNIEKTFEVNYKGFKLRGKIDGRYKIKNKIWLMEHKTKGQINESALLLGLIFDFQNLFYILSDEIENGERIQGMLYNIIRRPQSKPLKDETLKQYIDKLKNQVKTDPGYYFMRFEIPYTDNDKVIFARELQEILNEINMFMEGKLGFYRNQTGCNKPYQCEFLPACSSKKMTGYKQKEKLFMELS